MDRLDNGVIVCKLAKLIEMECNLVLPNGSLAAAGAAKTGTAAALNGSQTPPRTESHTTTPTWSTPGKSIQVRGMGNECLKAFYAVHQTLTILKTQSLFAILYRNCSTRAICCPVFFSF
mgnify:CR=1 FL=1